MGRGRLAIGPISDQAVQPMTERNKTYRGAKLSMPASAFGIKRLKGRKFAAFVVHPSGLIFRGEARDSWEECEHDIAVATVFVPSRVYAREEA